MRLYRSGVDCPIGVIEEIKNMFGVDLNDFRLNEERVLFFDGDSYVLKITQNGFVFNLLWD